MNEDRVWSEIAGAVRLARSACSSRTRAVRRAVGRGRRRGQAPPGQARARGGLRARARGADGRAPRRPYPWDYLLGSIHFLDGYAIDGKPSVDRRRRGRGGLAPLLRGARPAAASGLFDVLGHPDLVRMFGPELDWDWAEVAGSLDGAAVEVSTHAGCTSRTRSSTRIRLAGGRARARPADHARLRCPRPRNVGRDLDSAIEHARAAGYDTVTVFDQREARQEPLG